MKKWYFPYGVDIEKESVNNARIETFRDNILESLARETCQNSIDAAIDDSKPVKMIFEQKSYNITKNIEIDSFLKDAIPKARTTWKNDKKSQEFLDEYEKILKGKTINILRIADYNTTGLEKANWESLIENAGISVKNDISSAGSFGIGKSAPFASSDLRMVFYNTKTISGDEKAIGVTKFISFDNNDETTAQGVGYLGSEKKRPINRQLCFGFDKRVSPGTDLFIIGFNQDENWEEKIILSLLENFLIAIYKDMLNVEVGKTIINRNTMSDIIKNYNGAKYRELKNYYSVIEDYEKGKAKRILLDERFEDYGFKPEDGVLVISKSKDANRSVLMTRKAGMKIMNRKNISGSIQFNGIFQAKGDRFNEILREMENPNHDDWIPSRYRKNPKKAEKLLKDMYQFMKENVINEYQEKIEEQVDAFGMSDFLPNNISNENKGNETQNTGLDSRIVDIKINEYSKRASNQDAPTVEGIQKHLEEMGIIPGNTGGEGSTGQSSTNGNLYSGIPGPGDDDGDYDIDNGKNNNPDRQLVEVNKEFKTIENINYRVIERNYIEGKYIINIKSNKKIDVLKVEFMYLGENGIGNKMDIIESKFQEKNLRSDKNFFIVENIEPKRNYSINVRIPYKDRIKMEVVFYEYK